MTDQPISRRAFLKGAGLAAGAGTLACCGLTYAATRKPAPAKSVQAEEPSYHFAEDTTPRNRILVTYATRTGSTVGVAEAIGKTLAERGFAVDVLPMRSGPSPAGYAAVVLGSAINGARWLPEAVEYARDQQAGLANLPLALFCVHIMNTGADEKSRARRLAYLDEIRSLLPQAEEGFFAGMGMNPAEASWLERWAYRTFNIGQEGDCRDWDKINGWAAGVFQSAG